MRRPVLFRDWFSNQILFNMPDTFFICHGEPTQKPHHTTLQSFELAKIQTCYLYFAMLVGCWWGKAKFLGPGRVWAVNEFGVIVIISTRFSDPHRQLFRLFFPQRLAIFAAKRRSTKKKKLACISALSLSIDTFFSQVVEDFSLAFPPSSHTQVTQSTCSFLA